MVSARINRRVQHHRCAGASMSRFADAKRRRVTGGGAGGSAAGTLTGLMLCGTAVPAVAGPAPSNCTAGDLARVSATVAAQTADYLAGHPDVNEFFTNLKRAEH